MAEIPIQGSEKTTRVSSFSRPSPLCVLVATKLQIRCRFFVVKALTRLDIKEILVCLGFPFKREVFNFVKIFLSIGQNSIVSKFQSSFLPTPLYCGSFTEL
jgi:hypothetical protein